MPTTKKRDNGYSAAMLKREAPEYYVRFQGGEFESVRAACIAAGLIHHPTPLDILKRAWKAASAGDRKEFQQWVALAPTPLVDRDGYLTEATCRRIERAKAARSRKAGPVALELGYDRLDGRLGMATSDARRWKPNAEFLERLAEWLERYER